MKESSSHPDRVLTPPRTLPEAAPSTGSGQAPGGCEYRITQAERCNQPAKFVRVSTGFRYCAGHAEQAELAMRKQGRSLHLRPFRKDEV